MDEEEWVNINIDMVHMENKKAIGYDYDSLNDPTIGNKENVRDYLMKSWEKLDFRREKLIMHCMVFLLFNFYSYYYYYFVLSWGSPHLGKTPQNRL